MFNLFCSDRGGVHSAEPQPFRTETYYGPLIRVYRTISADGSPLYYFEAQLRRSGPLSLQEAARRAVMLIRALRRSDQKITMACSPQADIVIVPGKGALRFEEVKEKFESLSTEERAIFLEMLKAE